jgi:hypothetical protein
MRLETSIKRQAELVTALRDVYSSARAFHYSHERLLESREKVFARFASCPRHVLEFARGYARALDDSLYVDALVFGGIVDGVFYSTHRNRPDYYESHGMEPRDYADNGRVKNRGHYWGDDTRKPFSISAGV